MFSLLFSAWPPSWTLAAALLIALLVDLAWGELPGHLHPVAWMGGYLGWAGRRLTSEQPNATARVNDYKVFWIGAFAWCAGALGVGAAACLAQATAFQLPGVLAALLVGVLLKPMLAWRMLRDEVLAVEAALGQSLEAGRERLRWLVSRDVALLDEEGVRESAIESLAENLNDSVVAPIFWFVLLGLPGAAVYRFGNTADAMWGYRGVYQGRNWEWAGKWAARADDVLSWVPARITALLLMLVAWLHGLATRAPVSCAARLPRCGWRALQLEAARTPSPNSGWPMAAMALGLQVSLRKPQVYTLNARGKSPQAADTVRAIAYASHVVLLTASAAIAVILLLGKVPTA